MKLNNRGWGLREMILLSSILLLFLVIAIYFIVRLYDGLNESNIVDTNNSYSYSDVEKNLLNAALEYYNEYYDNEEDVKITSSKLKSHGYITTRKLQPDGEKKACIGYVSFYNGNMSSYISCGNYETDGYEE